jgi:hypothetical protein
MTGGFLTESVPIYFLSKEKAVFTGLKGIFQTIRKTGKSGWGKIPKSLIELNINVLQDKIGVPDEENGLECGMPNGF